MDADNMIGAATDSTAKSWVQAQRRWFGLIAGAAVLAYFGSTLVNAMDPYWSAMTGAILAYSAMMGWRNASGEGSTSVHLLAGAAMIVGGALLAWQTSIVMHRVGADNRRCAIIEREMLSASPRRTDLPELFQALKCRAQLDDGVELVGQTQAGAQINGPDRAVSPRPTSRVPEPSNLEATTPAAEPSSITSNAVNRQ